MIIHTTSVFHYAQIFKICLVVAFVSVNDDSSRSSKCKLNYKNEMYELICIMSVCLLCDTMYFIAQCEICVRTFISCLLMPNKVLNACQVHNYFIERRLFDVCQMCYCITNIDLVTFRCFMTRGYSLNKFKTETPQTNKNNFK